MKKGNYWLLFIVLLGLILRFWRLDRPFLDGWHSSSEGIYAAVSRECKTKGFNYCTTLAGENFPVNIVLMSFLFEAFGMSEQVSRIPAFISGVVTIIVLFKTTKEIWNYKKAILAALLLSLCPLHIHVSKLNLPDSNMILFSSLSMFYLVKWIKKRNFSYIAFASIFAAISGLFKITGLVYLFSILIFGALQKIRFGKKELFLILLTIISVSAIDIIFAGFDCSAYYLRGGLFCNTGKVTDYVFNWRFYIKLFGRLFVFLPVWPLAGRFIWFRRRELKNDELSMFLLINLIIQTIFIIGSSEASWSHDYYLMPLIIILTMFSSRALFEKEVILWFKNNSFWIFSIICLFILKNHFDTHSAGDIDLEDILGEPRDKENQRLFLNEEFIGTKKNEESNLRLLSCLGEYTETNHTYLLSEKSLSFYLTEDLDKISFILSRKDLTEFLNNKQDVSFVITSVFPYYLKDLEEEFSNKLHSEYEIVCEEKLIDHKVWLRRDLLYERKT